MASDDLIRQSGRANAILAADLQNKEGALGTPASERRAAAYSASIRRGEVFKQIDAVERQGAANPEMDNKPTLQRLRVDAVELLEKMETRDTDHGR